MDSPRRRVLVLDDDLPALETARLALATQFDVVVTHSPTQAIQFLREGDFWVVCSAQRMPGLTGAELYDKVRNGPHPAAFILFTAHGESAPPELVSGEMLSILEKPLDGGRLVRQVEQLVRLVQMRRNIVAAARPGSRASQVVAARPATRDLTAVPDTRPPEKSDPDKKS